MNESLKKLMDALTKDKSLLDKLKSSKNPQEAFEVAKTVADGLSFEDFKGALGAIKAMAGSGEMDDALMKKLAGGLKNLADPKNLLGGK